MSTRSSFNQRFRYVTEPLHFLGEEVLGPSTRTRILAAFQELNDWSPAWRIAKAARVSLYTVREHIKELIRLGDVEAGGRKGYRASTQASDHDQGT